MCLPTTMRSCWRETADGESCTMDECMSRACLSSPSSTPLVVKFDPTSLRFACMLNRLLPAPSATVVSAYCACCCTAAENTSTWRAERASSCEYECVTRAPLPTATCVFPATNASESDESDTSVCRTSKVAFRPARAYNLGNDTRSLPVELLTNTAWIGTFASTSSGTKITAASLKLAYNTKGE